MEKITKNKEINMEPYGKGIVNNININYSTGYGIVYIDITKNVDQPIKVNIGDKIKINIEKHMVKGKVIDIEDNLFNPEKSYIEIKHEE